MGDAASHLPQLRFVAKQPGQLHTRRNIGYRFFLVNMVANFPDKMGQRNIGYPGL